MPKCIACADIGANVNHFSRSKKCVAHYKAHHKDKSGGTDNSGARDHKRQVSNKLKEPEEQLMHNPRRRRNRIIRPN